MFTITFYSISSNRKYFLFPTELALSVANYLLLHTKTLLVQIINLLALLDM